MAKLIQKTEKQFTWQDLCDAVRDGSSGLKVGDEIAGVELKDGQIITLQVAWVAGDGTAVKLISKNCLKDEYQMNEDRRNRIKKLGDDAKYTDFWWCDSPHASSSTTFCRVGSNGSADGSASTALGVPVCLTIK